MRRDKADYDAAGLQIVLVGLGIPEDARQFHRSFDLPFTILCDPDKQGYRAFGLTRRLNLRHELSLQSISRLAQDAPRFGMAKTNQDILQLGGVFVIDPSGIVRFAFAALRASDRPALADVVASIQGEG